ncbi:MAG: hypothetical protein ABSF69_28030 [Polyangiaceae bacterium]|jgi:hypothetical protein
MGERRTAAEMSGEFLREAGVLVAVLGMLEKIVLGGWPSQGWTAAVLGAGLFLAVLGGIIELRRR